MKTHGEFLGYQFILMGWSIYTMGYEYKILTYDEPIVISVHDYKDLKRQITDIKDQYNGNY
jgi:hypothetical protein